MSRSCARATEDIKGLGLDRDRRPYEGRSGRWTSRPILVGHSFGGLIVELLLVAGTRPRSRRAEPGAAEGHHRAAARVAEGGLAGAGASDPLARRRAADARGVHPRVREHVHTVGGRGGRVRQVLRPRDRPDLLRGRLRQLPHPLAGRRPLRQGRPRAAADRGRREGPDRARVGVPQGVREVRQVGGGRPTTSSSPAGRT